MIDHRWRCRRPAESTASLVPGTAQQTFRDSAAVDDDCILIVRFDQALWLKPGWRKPVPVIYLLPGPYAVLKSERPEICESAIEVPHTIDPLSRVIYDPEVLDVSNVAQHYKWSLAGVTRERIGN